MGSQVNAKCRECGNTFTVMHGGGFFFHLVRCDQCGETQSIKFSDLGELHLRYLKGLPGPYAMVSREHDLYVKEHLPVEPISEDEYHKGIEALAGTCHCGGNYRLDAPPRCPKCHSTQIDEGEITMFYD
jgi:Zn finger protein HypA/HybF involved in hydrogenase expression